MPTRQQVKERARVLVERGRKRLASTSHDAHWRTHPAVPTGDALTLGERAADYMRSGLGTWTFLFSLAGAMALWIITAGFGHDAPPFILLNLCLSTLAGVQAAVLLIAAKRSDQVAAQTALHTLENTERIASLIEANTALTKQVERLTREVHTLVSAQGKPAYNERNPRTGRFTKVMSD